MTVTGPDSGGTTFISGFEDVTPDPSDELRTTHADTQFVQLLIYLNHYIFHQHDHTQCEEVLQMLMGTRTSQY